ncbi:MAG: hypothetical protein ACOCQ0_04060 [Desulfosalsimonas sp.]
MSDQQDLKKISIRYPTDLWRRMMILKAGGHITSIASLTLTAVEKEIRRLEKHAEKQEGETNGRQ